MRDTNEMEIQFDSKSCNEGFARVAVAAFLTQMNPTVEEVADVKTAVSEAVTNAIIHGYEKRKGKIRIFCRILENQFFMEVSDKGKGILLIQIRSLFRSFDGNSPMLHKALQSAILQREYSQLQKIFVILHSSSEHC